MLYVFESFCKDDLYHAWLEFGFKVYWEMVCDECELLKKMFYVVLNWEGLLWELVTLCLPIPLVPVMYPWVWVVTTHIYIRMYICIYTQYLLWFQGKLCKCFAGLLPPRLDNVINLIKNLSSAAVELLCVFVIFKMLFLHEILFYEYCILYYYDLKIIICWQKVLIIWYFYVMLH